MKRLVVVLSLFAMSAAAKQWTGYISDEKCGVKGNKAEHADCAVKCVKGGAAPVFVSGGKVYKLTDTAKVQDHVGHHVTISGKMTGDSIDVQSVKMVASKKK